MFNQVLDNLEENINDDEFFCNFEVKYNKEPIHIMFASCKADDDIRKSLPQRKSEIQQARFFRK